MTPFPRLSTSSHAQAILVYVTGLVIYFSIALLIMRVALF
jgi:hypothetical protein